MLSLCLIFHINSLSYTTQDIIQENAEFAKVCTLEDGNVLALSSVIGSQQMKVSKLDNQGRFIFKDETMNMGYTADAQLVQPANSDNYLLTHHNRQNVAGHEAKEYILTFKDTFEKLLLISKNITPIKMIKHRISPIILTDFFILRHL